VLKFVALEVFLRCAVLAEAVFTPSASTTVSRRTNLVALGAFMLLAIPATDGNEESSRIVREIPRSR
jgi:hypothetical protein